MYSMNRSLYFVFRYLSSLSLIRDNSIATHNLALNLLYYNRQECQLKAGTLYVGGCLAYLAKMSVLTLSRSFAFLL